MREILLDYSLTSLIITTSDIHEFLLWRLSYRLECRIITTHRQQLLPEYRNTRRRGHNAARRRKLCSRSRRRRSLLLRQHLVCTLDTRIQARVPRSYKWPQPPDRRRPERWSRTPSWGYRSRWEYPPHSRKPAWGREGERTVNTPWRSPFSLMFTGVLHRTRASSLLYIYIYNYLIHIWEVTKEQKSGDFPAYFACFARKHYMTVLLKYRRKNYKNIL